MLGHRAPKIYPIDYKYYQSVIPHDIEVCHLQIYCDTWTYAFVNQDKY